MRTVLPIVFVYTGNALPSYAKKSLALNLEYNASPLVLLTDAAKPLWLSREVHHTDIRDFYSFPDVRAELESFRYSDTFRNGFWIKTIERFAVLSEWAKFSLQREFFHSELDNLNLGLQDVPLENTNLPGLALPRESALQAVASLVLIGDAGLLDTVLRFFFSNSGIGNEMEMLAAFLDQHHSSRIRALPTVANMSSGAEIVWNSFDVADFGGVFDAAAVGRWLYGPDPRNSRGRPTRNLQQHPRTRGDLKSLKFGFRQGQMFVTDDARFELRLYNIHVHSKIFSRLAHVKRHSALIARANAGRSSLIAGADGGFVASETVRWVLYALKMLGRPRMFVAQGSKRTRETLRFVRLLVRRVVRGFPDEGKRGPDEEK